MSANLGTEIFENCNNDFCTSVLEFIIKYDIAKYKRVQLISFNDALNEMSKICIEMHEMTEIALKLKDEYISDSELESIENISKMACIFLVHVCSIFSRLMVSAMINLANDVEPHMQFWRNQTQLNGKGGDNDRLMNIFCIFSMSIAFKREKVFHKLLSDLYIQIGHCQFWFWSLCKIDIQQCKLSDVIPFVMEMQEIFGNASAKPMVEEKENMNENPLSWMKILMETMTTADAFFLKMSKDIQVWGRPSHWKRNWKLYSLTSFASLISSSIAYYYYLNRPYFCTSILGKCESFAVTLFKQLFTSTSMVNEEKKRLERMLNATQVEHKSMEVNSHPVSVMIEILRMRVSITDVLLSVDRIANNNLYFAVLATSIPLAIVFYVSYKRIWNRSKCMNELKHHLREVHTLLIENQRKNQSMKSEEIEFDTRSESYLDYKSIGKFLTEIFRIQRWGLKFLAGDQLRWLRKDTNNLIDTNYSIHQLLNFLYRIEIYYLYR